VKRLIIALWLLMAAAAVGLVALLMLPTPRPYALTVAVGSISRGTLSAY
jgi:hypothetical protein